MTMTGFHPSRPIPRPQEPGAMHLNTSAGEKKETVSKSLAVFTASQCMTAGVPMRRGVGFLRAGVLSLHQSEISGHRCLSQTRNWENRGCVFSPRIHTRIHRILTNPHPAFILL